MALWFAALLGLVQGISEFLPISSTAHLRILPALLGQPDPGAAFTAVIQLGTLLAVLIYFGRDLFVSMPRAMLRDRKSIDGRLPFYIALGTIPIVIAGVSFKRYIVGDLRSLYSIAGALAVWGIVMMVADRRARTERSLELISWVDALIIGGAQALALFPGVSRSGATIVAALFLGLRRSDAARFSFLLGIPAILAAGIYELKDARATLGDGGGLTLFVGTAVAAVSGYASIAWLLKYLSSKTLTPFGIYRLALAGILLGLCLANVVPATEPTPTPVAESR